MRRALAWVSTLGLLAALASAPFSASARDRPLELLLVNMTPASARPECMRDITRVIRREDVTIHRIGGDRVRELAGHDEDGLELTAWDADDLDAATRVVRTETPIDAIVLVDCRGDQGRADVWVRAPTRGVSRLRVRQTSIDVERAEWIARLIVMQAWVGFEP